MKLILATAPRCPRTFENRDDVVGVLFRFQKSKRIKRREPDEHRARPPRKFRLSRHDRDAILQDLLWRARGEAQVVWQVVEKLLVRRLGVFNARSVRNSDGVQPKKDAEFMPGTTERKGHKEREATLYFNLQVRS